MTAACLSDGDLLCRCRNGDRPAFGEIVVRYEGLVRALAFSACGDSMHSEDIAQETFVTAWRRLSDLRDAGRLRPWLCAIARSTARMARRKASRRPEAHGVALAELAEIPDTAPPPDESLAQRDSEKLVWEVLKRLPPGWREVLVLHYREEHSTALIATELGISESAVRQRLVRGRALLRNRLAHLVESSLERGGRSAAALAVATVAALPEAAGAPIPSSGIFTSISTPIAAMTKIQAAAAGIVLAALAGAPIILHQSHTIARLRPGQSTSGVAQAPSGTLEGGTAEEAGAGAANGPRSLNDLRRLLANRPSRRHTAVLWRLVEGIPADEMPRLLLEALKLRGTDWRDKEIAALLLERMAELNAAGAAELIAQLDPEAKVPALAQFAAIAPAEALTLLKSLPGADLARVLGDAAALDSIAVHDPAATGLLLAGLPMSSAAAPKFARLAQLWAARDPQSALAWAESLDFEQVRTQAFMALYPEWAKHDRAGAFAALERVPAGPLRRNLFDEMAWEVISGDQAGAERWVRELQGPQQHAALGLLAARVAGSDLDRGRALLEEAVGSGHRWLTWPSEEVARIWAQGDPAAAAHWAMTLPDGDIRQHAAEGVTRAWVATDPVAASKWIATLPPGDARNGATYYLVEGISGADPASGFHWASSISDDPEKRLYLLQRSVDSWKKSSPDAARAAIENSPLSEGERESLLRRL